MTALAEIVSISDAQRCSVSWCTSHIDDEAGALHASRDVTVPMTAGRRNDHHAAAVSVERSDEDGDVGRTTVRLEVSGGFGGLPKGGPMTPEQALALSRELERAARLAMRSTAVTV